MSNEQKSTSKGEIVDCPKCGGKGTIVKKRSRSNEQNRYYWGVVTKMIAMEIGDDSESVHDMLREKYCSLQRLLPDGTVHHKKKSTASLSSDSFESYLASCRKWALDYCNLTIPLPNEMPDEFENIIRAQYQQVMRSTGI